MSAVLVTGTSSGIGRAIALQLTRSGYRVLAGVRDLEDAQSLVSEAAGLSGELKPIQIDVTDEASITDAATRAKELTDIDGLVALVNNAGQPIAGPLEILPIVDFRQELEINLIGQLAVTQAFLPMLRASRGRLVFITSIGGRVALPFAGAYHASKFALESIAEVLRMELHGSGVQVVSIEPGVTDSRIWEKAESQSQEMLANLPAPQRHLYEADMDKFRERIREVQNGENMGPEEVAKSVQSAIESRWPPTRSPVGRSAWVAARIRPLIADRIWGFFARRAISG